MDHSQTIRNVEEGDFFHTRSREGNWTDLVVTELEEFRSSYRTDRVHYEAVDDEDRASHRSKSRFKGKVRDEDETFHKGRQEECDLCGA